MNTNKWRKKPIKDMLDPEVEKPVLEQFYLAHGVAIDQLRRQSGTLIAITSQFNLSTGRSFNAGELLRYMMNRRKQADWPKLGKNAKKFESVLNMLSHSEINFLKQIYFELDEASDEYLFQPHLMGKIADRFEALTGRRVQGAILLAAIVAKRKRGLWVKIREAFADVEVVA